MTSENDKQDGPDEVQRRIRIRVAALGHTSIKEFHRDYSISGGTRSYQWWWGLSESSSVQAVTEAAQALGVPLPSLLGGRGANDSDLLKVGIGESSGRVAINE